MASISLPSSSSPSIPCSSSSSSYSPSLLLLHRRNAPHHQPRRSRRRSSVSTSRFRIVGPILAVDGATSVLDPSQDFSELLASLKLKLLSSVSGLNRGLAATEEDIRKSDDAAKELEAVGGPVDLSVNIDKLQGKWKLIYSSAFSSRTLGGSRPGPPTGRLLPITLGQVFQRIDTVSKDFDNIVELELGAPWPFPPVEVTAKVAHKFELIV